MTALSLGVLLAAQAGTDSPPRVLFLTHSAGYRHAVVTRPSAEELSLAERKLVEAARGRFAEMHGQAPDPKVEERMYQAMCVWDDFMAASAAAFVRRRRLDRIVIVAGGGHTDFGFGIPDRTARRLGAADRVVLHIAPTLEEARSAEPGIADFILVPRP